MSKATQKYLLFAKYKVVLYTRAKVFCMSLRTKNLPVEKFCPYEVNFLCGNLAEAYHMQTEVLTRTLLNAHRQILYRFIKKGKTQFFS